MPRYTDADNAQIIAALRQGWTPTEIGRKLETALGRDREAVRMRASRLSRDLPPEITQEERGAPIPISYGDEPLNVVVRNAIASEVDAITERILARLSASISPPTSKESLQVPPSRRVPSHGREVALFDIHHPHHDRASIAAVSAFMADYQPNVLILGGDAIDAGPFSHWNNNKVGLLKTLPDPKEMYATFVADILRPFHEIVGPDCYIVYLLGNHEDWVRQALEADPRGTGYWEVANNLDGIPDAVIPYVDGGEPNHFQFGKLFFIHGYRTNLYHARASADDYNRPIRYGHVHDVQAHTHRTAIDVHDFHIAQSCGCLCNLNPVYQRNRPSRWVHAFQYGEMIEDGSFCDSVPVIVNGRFRAEGKWYG